MVCSVCLDDDVVLAFNCPKKKCQYGLCEMCVKLALEDASGASCRDCPICKTPTARLMVESLCGVGAVREVERDLRARVELEVQKENVKKQRGREMMSSFEEKAHELYLKLSDSLNMKCPRCSLVFHDYEGCNALKCSNSGCQAAFCAVCLMDCGNDAHPHARTHGGLFDKTLFEREKENREKATIEMFLSEHVDEPFEVKELLKIKCEKLISISPTKLNQTAARTFLHNAKTSLREAVRKDRLSVLSDLDKAARVLTSDHISPRNAIPDDYKLCLFSGDGFKCRIVLSQLIDGNWKVIPLPKEEDELKKPGNNRLVVDALINVRRSLQSCSLAFEGSRCLYQTSFARAGKGVERAKDDEISMQFFRINSVTGEASGDGVALDIIGCSGRRILGLNQNQRMLLLEQHVEGSEDDSLLFEPLLHFIGANKAARLLESLSVPAPDTFKELNNRQQFVAHPLSIKTAMECAGPPGTGKTKVITELMRSVLFCTEYHVVILSERNGAVDAIAEKITGECIAQPLTKGRTVKNFTLWRQILSFGSAGMGSFSRLFTLEEKLKMHPELVVHRRKIIEKEKNIASLTKTMLRALAAGIEALGPGLPQGYDSDTRSTLIASGHEADLTSPLEIIHTVSRALDKVGNLLEETNFTEEELTGVVVDNSSVLGRLVPFSNNGNEKKKSTVSTLPWSQRRVQALRALKSIKNCLEKVLRHDFSVEKAKESTMALKQAEEDHNRALGRIRREIVEDARVVMGTIGSSHKFPVPDDQETNDDDDNIERALVRLNINQGAASGKETIVVFDEAGCIPAYELLGISRLKRNVKSLICVGDKHQLPPYAPDTMSDKRNFFGRRAANSPSKNVSKVDSLLDVSRLEEDGDRGGKIRLTTQYRVPCDIANVLNERIYKGNYRTAINSKVPNHGFRFIHVDCCYDSRKYENDNEVQKTVELVKCFARPVESLMVLTPYKKQQRKLQYELKRHGFGEDVAPVLTIDQCQGQEADTVILSLVQRPTRFLNKNRFNVALSRVRQNLYMLCDKKEFQQAARNSSWECNLLAKDLLQLAAATDSVRRLDSDEDSDDYFDAYYR